MHNNWGAVIGISVALGVLQRLSTARKGAEGAVKELIGSHAEAQLHFIALEYCYGMLNRTYLLFVTEQMICGAKVRGLLPAPMVVTDRWKDPTFYPEVGRLKRYAGISVESPEFRKVHIANFQYPFSSVHSVEFSTEPKWGMGSVPYSGRIFVTLAGGKKRDFILLGSQDGPAIVKALKSLGGSRAAA